MYQIEIDKKVVTKGSHLPTLIAKFQQLNAEGKIDKKLVELTGKIYKINGSKIDLNFDFMALLKADFSETKGKHKTEKKGRVTTKIISSKKAVAKK